MNKVFLCGYLTRDVDFKQTATTAVARVGIAVNRRTKDQADFFNLVAFGKIAEVMNNYFGKGSKILVEGHLQTSSYEKDGVKKTSTDIIVEQVEFADSKKKAAATGDKSNIDYGGTPVDDSDTIPPPELLNDF